MDKLEKGLKDLSVALREVAILTGKTPQEVVRKSARYIALQAARNTGKASKSSIPDVLGMARIIQWRRKKAGLPGLKRKELMKAARRAASARRRSIGYLGLGWRIAAAKVDGKSVPRSNSKSPVTTSEGKSKPLGLANAQAYISNKAAGIESAEGAFSKAVAQEVVSTKRYLEKKIRDIVKRAAKTYA